MKKVRSCILITPCEIEDRRFSRSCTLRANFASTEAASGTGIGGKGQTDANGKDGENGLIMRDNGNLDTGHAPARVVQSPKLLHFPLNPFGFSG